MSVSLEKTFDVLSSSRNDAVGPVLINALQSDNRAISDGVIQSIVARRGKSAHMAVLGLWHMLEPYQRDFVIEGRGRLSGALRDAALSDDTQLFENACELVEQFSEFDLVPTLVTLAENQKSNHAAAATKLVLHLVDHLSEMVNGPRDYSDRRDPESIRRFVLESLERSVERFHHHQRAELIEAFVVLGGPSCSLLRSILDAPHHPCYTTVVDTLSKSDSSGVIDLLLNFLKTDSTSLNILNIISSRNDNAFVARLLTCTEDKVFPKVRKNIGRIRLFGCMASAEKVTTRFNEQDQARCVKLASASGMKQDDLLEILRNLLEHGEPAARLAACEALAKITGDLASRLILNATHDKDPLVQASAIKQLRDRHVPGAMAILLKQIDSPHEAVREATREALSEFTFKNFLAGFEALQEDARRSTGKLVNKVDPETIPGLAEELESQSRKHRMRAIEMTEVMDLIPTMSKHLVVMLLDDDDHLVRAAAADALQFSPTAEVQEALHHALKDRSGAVQSAARTSLAAIEEAAGLPTEGQQA